MSKKAAQLDQIARRLLSLQTLDTRNSDGLDFTDQAVWNIREALSQAYAAGAVAGQSTTPVADEMHEALEFIAGEFDAASGSPTFDAEQVTRIENLVEKYERVGGAS